MKILLAYDGGEPAQRALTLAANIAKAMGGSVDVVSVVPVHAGRVAVDPWDDHDVHAAELRDARNRLAELGIPAKLFEPGGEPSVTIERLAKEGSYDMVVLGSRRQSVLGRVLQGSVSEHVATHADATVVIAH
jgi:nucleotide-binding universal stress UspA family protein